MKPRPVNKARVQILENNNSHSALGAVLSGILTLVTWIWNIEPLKFVFTFLFGSFVTYYIQSKLQDRTEKKKIIRELIEKIYGPLYNELQSIDENLVNGFNEIYRSPYDFGGEGKCELWKSIKTYPEFFSIPVKLQSEIEELMFIAEKINNSIDDLKRIIQPILINVSKSILKPDYSNIRDIYVDYHTFRDKILYSQPLYYYAIFNKDPIEDVKSRFNDFNLKLCKVTLIAGDKTIYVPLSEIKEDLNKILYEVKQKMMQEKEVKNYMEDRKDLSEKLNTMIPKIKKLVETNYPIIKP